MSSRQFSGSVRSLIYCAALLAFTASILVIIGKNGGSRSVSAQDGPVVESPAAVFPGTNTGAIPDNQCNVGTGRIISFNVTGLTGAPTDVQVNFTGTHDWVGDLWVTLYAPGGSPFRDIFVLTGDGLESSNLGGTYNFLDTATNNWWTVGAATGDVAIPPGNYRTSDDAGVNTTLTTPFAGMANANGTWTIEFNDCGAVDTGTISAANLTITTPAVGPTPLDALADFNADGKTDPTVIRVAGGANSQATWWIKQSNGPEIATDWGIGSDTFVPADYDGDHKDDVAIWRPGAQAYFYIIRSTNSTVRIEGWGTNGDDPTVVGDYNADHKDDIAIYRPGPPSFGNSIWFWKAEGGGSNQFEWGIGTDFPAPGDYDGDNKIDYAVQRPVNGFGVSEFWIWSSLNSNFTVTVFGTATDFVVPGDYDGDLKTDVAVLGSQNGNWLWSYRPSNGGPDVAFEWGVVSSDDPAPGDYDGDGKADYAVWRIAPQSQFWAKSPGSPSFVYVEWGSGNVQDTPVTLSFVH